MLIRDYLKMSYRVNKFDYINKTLDELSQKFKNDGSKIKKIVIDSLARSGTTLLTALIRSQDKCCAFTGCFSEALVSNYGTWPHGLIRHPLIPKNEKMLFSWDKMLEEILKTSHCVNQRYNISEKDWFELLNQDYKTLSDIDELYKKLAYRLNSDLIAFRWNQSISYIYQWIERPEHYWIVLIRNPMSRACSSYKTHKWSWQDSLINSIVFYKTLDIVKTLKEVVIVYYEDLIKNPKEELIKIFDKIKFNYNQINITNIIGSDNKPYRPETADSIINNGTHKKGEVFRGFYLTSENRYTKEMPEDIQVEYCKKLSKFSLLKRYFENTYFHQRNDYKIDKNQLFEIYNKIFFVSKISFDYFTSISKIFMKISSIDGDIIEFGVYKGQNTTIFGNLIKYYALNKKYYGFDTFCGYTIEDIESSPNKKGLLENQLSGRWNYSKTKVESLLNTNQLSSICHIIQGDIKQTFPLFLKKIPSISISLLYVDCNAFLPAYIGMKHALRYMKSGSIICIDEHKIGGETKALYKISEEYDLEIIKTNWKYPYGPPMYIQI